jgi:hypothetical protein
MLPRALIVKRYTHRQKDANKVRQAEGHKQRARHISSSDSEIVQILSHQSQAGTRLTLSLLQTKVCHVLIPTQLKFVLEDVLCVQNAKDGRLSHDYLHASVVCC